MIVLPQATTEGFTAVSPYTQPVRRPVEPVGRYFLAHALRTLRGHTWSEYEKIEAANNVTKVEENEDEDLGDEQQDEELLDHDPREWKTADLYAVLGISHLRWRATEDQIRRAHRKQVLTHHPDKKSASGGLEQDGFFKIIQKAFETMLDTNARRQFDSVDENADVVPPNAKESYDFYEAWGPVFEAESRFSKKGALPALGGADATKEEVDNFYSAWGKFDSWKTFEWKDEDVPDDTANRDHKRYIEKKNVSNRKKLKQEDNKRLIDLVERAYLEDPRIRAFKEAAKAEKERKRLEKTAGSRAAAAKKAEEEAAAAKKAEEEASAKVDKKKAKEAAKSAKKKNKRAVRAAAADISGDKAAIEADVDTLLEKLDDEKLGALVAALGDKKGDAAKADFIKFAEEAGAALKELK